MRPKTNSELPPCLYERRGSYFYVKAGQWINLGRDRAAAIAAAPRLADTVPLAQEQVLAYALKVLYRARQNAKGRRQISFSLTKDDVREMLIRAGWRCAVTRAPFSLEKFGVDRPFAPSIDRVDSARGYEPGNCRIVCVATNFAMNRWGEAVLRTLLHHMKRPAILDTSNT